MEVELEVLHHDLNHLLCVLHKALLELTGVAHQHLTRSGFLLQACCADAKALLQQ